MPHNDPNRYSNDMKDEILIILAEVSLHEKDIETAQQELLDLFLVSKREFKVDDLVVYEAEEWVILERGDGWATIERNTNIAVVDTNKISHVC